MARIYLLPTDLIGNGKSAGAKENVKTLGRAESIIGHFNTG